MPAKGKHRRPKSIRIARSIAVAGTGGAALALPLIGATGAEAATPQSAPAVTAGAQNAAQAPAERTAVKTSEVRTYAVKVGDHLSKIADEQAVQGGWQRLYDDNRGTVGSDPGLIHPGLKLTIGAKAAAAPEAPAPKPAAPKAEAPEAAAPKAQPKTAEPEPVAPQAVAPQAAPAEAAAPEQADSGWTRPVDSGVGTGYRASGSMWSSGYHTGVDFSVPAGTPLKSVGPGTVVSAGWAGSYGNQVVIQHTDGKYSQYAHLSQLTVSAGQSVTGGHQIGLAGSTGNSTGPHLHFEIRTSPDYGSDIDPMSYLRSKGVGI
ncbi:M23 family metallopeptidase [Streptomyces uncialis]|uniref:M23 family metallopeptidase n=1 Tax=Streptomyces uncialis TaxID=1048205 RepID=UPI0037FFA4EA